MTGKPFSARHAPVTNPTYPAPITAILFKEILSAGCNKVLQKLTDAHRTKK